MNRKETALTCLERLSSQTRRPDATFVVDNASEDGTIEALTTFQATNTSIPLEILGLPENLGNAGGMEIAFKKILEAGYDHIWVLDDDSWPEPEALSRLLEIKASKPIVRSCRVVDLATGGLSWPLQIHVKGKWQTLESQEPLPEGDVIKIRRAWLGAMFPKEICEKVGPINGELFLRGEDEDYPRRIENAGFEVMMATHSLLHHPPAGKLLRASFLGKEAVIEAGLKPNNLYYRLRNQWWLTRKQKGLTQALGLAFIHLFILSKDSTPASVWCPVWWEALVDAISGRLGARRNTK